MTNQYISAIFYREEIAEPQKIKIYMEQNENTLLLEHITVQFLADDLDPSFNFALARGLYEKIYKFQVRQLDDYIELLNNEEHFFKFSDILYQINQCDTLIDGTQFKIMFLNYNQFFEEKLKLQKVDLQSDNVAQETKQFFQHHNIVEYINNNLHADKTLFCILNSEDVKIWVNLYEGLFQGIYQSENQKWISKSLVEMQPIDEETFKQIKGFIVTGSHHDAYDTSMPWVPYSYDIINKIIYPKQENNQKLLGICWGHQAVGHGCGGKASKMPHKTMYQFRDQIKFNDLDIDNKLNLSKILPNPFFSVKCHGDHVYELPKEGKLIASSDRVEIDGIAIRNRALTFQFHPEFNKMILLKIIRQNNSNSEYIQKQYKSAFESFSQDHTLSNLQFNKVIKEYLSS